MGTQKRSLAAILVGLGLVAAACGGSDDGGTDGTGTETEGSAADGPTTSVSIDIGSTITTQADNAQPTSMEEWEALWAEERAAIVAEVESEGYGLSADGKTLTGAGGLEVDLSNCPGNWSNTEGLTDTEIKMGQTGAASGTLADSINYYRAINALFDHYNDAGAFKDSEGKTRKVVYLNKDDGYDPARTIPLVDELIDSEKVFAVQTLGTPNTMKVYDKLNERCVPNPYAITSHPAWNDPVKHPWTTGLNLTYSTEAVLWGAFIKARLDTEFGGKVTVAALVMNNDFGKIYDAAFKQYLKTNDLEGKVEYITETIEPQAATITNEMTTLASKDPDIFIQMLAGTPCQQAVIEAAQNGLQSSAKYLFVGQPCGNNATMGKDKVGGDGMASEGWWLVGGGARDMTDATQAELPFVQFMRGLLEAKGIDPASSGNLNYGTFFGFPLIQAFILAGEFPGGLTRTNFILAQWMMDITHPFVIEGNDLVTKGVEDAYPIEGGIYQQYSVEKQAFVKQSDVISLAGESPPCAWNQSTSTCE
ncbi:MAG: ABC transporter substrate-binding protein [Acidimicrobiales bacterium]